MTPATPQKRPIPSETTWQSPLGLLPTPKKIRRGGAPGEAMKRQLPSTNVDTWSRFAPQAQRRRIATMCGEITSTSTTGRTEPGLPTPVSRSKGGTKAAKTSAASTATQEEEAWNTAEQQATLVQSCKARVTTPILLELAQKARGNVKRALSVTQHLTLNKVVVQEERKFAGEKVVVEKTVDKDSREAAKAAKSAERTQTRLQRLVESLKRGNRVSIVDKTKADWEKWKQREGQTVQEELEAYKKSSNKYLDRQDFLKRAELREYEIERDKRLAGDMRTRGR